MSDDIPGGVRAIAAVFDAFRQTGITMDRASAEAREAIDLVRTVIEEPDPAQRAVAVWAAIEALERANQMFIALQPVVTDAINQFGAALDAR